MVVDRLYITKADELQEFLNGFGEGEWELISITEGEGKFNLTRYIFKRKIVIHMGSRQNSDQSL